MKTGDIVLGLVGVVGLGVGGFFIYNKSKPGAPTATNSNSAAGSSASDYSSGAYADWASQQKPSYALAEPIGIFKTVVDSAMSLISEPRGIRNNNPLNIEWNAVNNWVGLKGSDGRFCIFDKPENGIRAAAKVLDSYAKRGLVTIEQIIGTWAPKSENNVKSYVDHVCQLMGRKPNSVIVKVAGDYVPLLTAMIKHENGKQPYSVATIQAGVNLS